MISLDANETVVADLAPLNGMSLKTLGLQRTKVSDLSPLMVDLDLVQMKGQDLSPLAGMNLEQFYFSAERIRSGSDAIRKMDSLKTIGTLRPGDFMSCERKEYSVKEFWKLYDEGAFPPNWDWRAFEKKVRGR